MDKDIQRILSSDDRLKTWCDVIKIYMDRSFVIDHNIELYQEFILRASNAGIIHAHGQAADYYLNTDKNCDEAEKRMRLLMEDKDNLSAGDVHSIMSAISMYMIRGNVLSDGLEDVVVTLINWGYPIEKDSTGVYVMLSKRENLCSQPSRFYYYFDYYICRCTC